MEAKCRNKDCQNKKDMEKMFYYKVPIKRNNGEIMFGAFAGFYFCNSACWLVYKKVITAISVIKELRCKKEPTCDNCFLRIHHLPILYDHKPVCEETHVGQLEGEGGKTIKRCANCEVSNEMTNCVSLPKQEEIMQIQGQIKDG